MKHLFLTLTFFVSYLAYSQNNSSFWIKSDTLNKSRRNALIISETALAGVTLFALAKLCSSDYPRSNFQLVNDNNQWKQMDKVGHIMSSYYIGKIGMDLLDWSLPSQG